MALFGFRELINILEEALKALTDYCRNHVARFEYGYGTLMIPENYHKMLIKKILAVHLFT